MSWAPTLRGAALDHPAHILDLLEPRLGTQAPAVVDRDGALSYADLDAASARVAGTLRALGVRPDEPVLVHTRLCRWAVVGMLGALRAGACYVPVDVRFPVARQQAMATASGARLSLVEPEPVAHLTGPKPLPIDDGPSRSPNAAAERGPRGSLAYICFTSGSTGQPKPVRVPAAALAASTWARFAYYPEPVRTFLLCSSISFDSSVAGIYWTLGSGGTLVIPSEHPTDLLALGRACVRHQASHLLLVPTLYAALLRGGLADRLASLRTVIVAGEACSPRLVAQHLAALPDVRLYNEYGPTECTVWSTVHACGPADAVQPSVPIGGPIPGTLVYVRDEHGAPVPPGTVGELYLGGAGLTGPGPYRTGDLVSVRDDGELAYHGRADSQLKLGGVRLERAEIDHALAGAPGVADAAVGVAGDRLVGFVVPLAEPPNRAEVRAYLMVRLPIVAIPNRLRVVDRLPRLPNDKLDHRELDRMAGSPAPS